jgi:hypothetical protein
MAASHYAYNVLKMPGPISVITIPRDKKDALICADQLYREVVAAAAAKALAPAVETPRGRRRRPVRTLSLTPASAPLQSATPPSRMSQRVPPARARRTKWLHQ